MGTAHTAQGIVNQGYPISVGTDLIPNSRDRVVRAVDTEPRLQSQSAAWGSLQPAVMCPPLHTLREVNRPVPHNRSCSIMGTACTAQGYSQSRLPHQCGNPAGLIARSWAPSQGINVLDLIKTGFFFYRRCGHQG